YLAFTPSSNVASNRRNSGSRSIRNPTIRCIRSGGDALLRVKRLFGTTLIAAAVALSLIAVRSLIGEQARAEAMVRAEATRQASRDQSELRAIEDQARAAADLHALNAALAAHVDSVTILDLLDSEDWWLPYRDQF